jgi:NAD+--asparagine ADP-ribosyltransferase
MTSLEGLLNESDQFWLDIAAGTCEWQGCGVKGKIADLYGEEYAKVIGKKISEVLQGENNGMYGIHRFGKKDPHYGRKQTRKSRKKISKVLKRRYALYGHPSVGRVLSEETKEKIRQKAIGRRQSRASIKKRSEKLKGKIPWNKGKKMQDGFRKRRILPVTNFYSLTKEKSLV